MTTKKPWPVETVVKKARKLFAGQQSRIDERIDAAAAEVVAADEKQLLGWLERVPEGTERELCRKMLYAAGIDTSHLAGADPSALGKAIHSVASLTTADDETPSRLVLDEYAADLELPAGAKPYVPSAVAQAALGRRR